MLTAGAAPIPQSASFFIVNRSEEPILSVVILIVASNPNTGVRRTGKPSMDGFRSRPLRPVLQPGERALVMPAGGITPEKVLSIALNSRYPPAKQTFDWLVGTGLPVVTTVSISVDSLIFASGEVQGPDTDGFMQEVPNRYRAAQSVLSAINGNDATSLMAMANQQVQQNDGRFSQWQHRFAADYLGAKDAAQQAIQIRNLQSYAAPPPLFRKPSLTN